MSKLRLNILAFSLVFAQFYCKIKQKFSFSFSFSFNYCNFAAFFGKKIDV